MVCGSILRYLHHFGEIVLRLHHIRPLRGHLLLKEKALVRETIIYLTILLPAEFSVKVDICLSGE